MAIHLKNEACPKCLEMGKDNHRDNLGRYTDGSAYCWSCAYYEGPRRLDLSGKYPTLKPAPQASQKANKSLQWLSQWLTKAEISEYFYFTGPGHVFKHAGYWELRNTSDPEKPKCISSGEKPFFITGNLRSGVVVLVEDIVSAIVVGRVYGAMPLFGSHLKPEYMLRLAKYPEIEKVLIWLDYDKYPEACKLGARLAPFKDNQVISTKEDPKCYKIEQVQSICCPFLT